MAFFTQVTQQAPKNFGRLTNEDILKNRNIRSSFLEITHSVDVDDILHYVPHFAKWITTEIRRHG